MQLTNKYLDIWSTPQFTMTSYINYKDTLFEQANLNPIRGKPTIETIKNIRNEIKAKSKSVYSNIRGEAYGHLGLVLTINGNYLVITLFSPC